MAGSGANPVPPCYIKAMKEKPKPKPNEIEELPDAWERFEKAFDTVIKAKPKPAKKTSPSRARGGKRGGSKPA
jgi:hypothetical protein